MENDMTLYIAAQAADAILEHLPGDRYVAPDGALIEGQALSFVISNTSRRHLPSRTADAEARLEELGFTIIRNCRNERGQRATVVTL